MFDKFIEWRLENDVDNIMVNYVMEEEEAFQNQYSHNYFGVDKIGRPFYVDKAGYVLVYELLKVSTEERIIRDVIYHYEKLIKVRCMACSDLYDRQIY